MTQGDAIAVYVCVCDHVCVNFQVLMQDEVRRVDSQEYRDLQSLYEESEFRLKQVSQHPQVYLLLDLW